MLPANPASLNWNFPLIDVLNILGGESRQVTPTSHAFSGGNVVFGTSPGRAGQKLKTPGGAIPVYNNVREGLTITSWKEDYNRHRPHSALGNMTPAEFALKSTLEKQAA